MVKTSEIGSNVIISFQTKYPTFSYADWDKVMTELGFQRVTNTTTPKGGQPQQIVFTKENISVDVDWQNSILNFRFFNRINVMKVHDTIQKILLSLKIDPSSINVMGLTCTTMAHDVGIPTDNLTSLISNEAKSRIAKILLSEPTVNSIVFMNKSAEEEDLQIRIEPLFSNPQESFYININYRTKVHEKFDNFIGTFGEDTIKEIALSICDKNAKNN